MAVLMSIFSFLEALVQNYTGILTVIGIPLLTFFVTKSANRSAEDRAANERRTERKLAAELKLVEFRQQWIENLRADFSEFLSMASMADEEFKDWEALTAAAIKIQLAMNPKDKAYPEIIRLVNLVIAQMVADTDKQSKSAEKLALLMQATLKREWDRLKVDLKNVEILNE